MRECVYGKPNEEVVVLTQNVNEDAPVWRKVRMLISGGTDMRFVLRGTAMRVSPSKGS